MAATWASVIDAAGVPLTEITPSATSRSSAEASIRWAAMATTLSRTPEAADRAALPAMTAERLPPVPNP